MSYVEKVLLNDEKVLYEARLSLWAKFPSIALGVVLTPFFGFGLLILLGAYLTYKSTELAVTNKRVIAKFGFISRKTTELSLQKIESIQVEQGVLGRIFDHGSLIISGAGNPQAPIPGISNLLGFRTAFAAAQDRIGQPIAA